MFGKKKQSREIENKLLEIKREKEELLKIKELLEDTTPKVDISNVYIWECDGISSIVRYYVKPIVGRSLGGAGAIRNGFESTLVDIFSEQIVYKKCSIELIKERELVKDLTGKYTNSYARFNHILEFDKRLLVYPDKRVPKYILQQDYYALNYIDITKSKILNKGK